MNQTGPAAQGFSPPISPPPKDTISAVLASAVQQLEEDEKALYELLMRLGVMLPPGTPVGDKAPSGVSGGALSVRTSALRLAEMLREALQQV